MAAPDEKAVSLANAPFGTAAELNGRRGVPSFEVEDWQIILPDGKVEGAFSLLALFAHWESSENRLTPRIKSQKEQFLSAGWKGITS